MASKFKLARYASSAMLLIAAILLFLAQSSYWINHEVFNQANFTRITTTEVLAESSRDAIANAIVNKAFDKRPVIKRVAGERTSSLISGLLGSDFSNQAVTALTSNTYAYITASNRQDIKLDLTGIKTPIQNLASLAQNNGVSAPRSDYQIPDEIVLVQSDSLPNLSGMVKAMLWLAPLLWLGTILLFVLYIYIGRADYARRVYAVGATIAIVSIVGLALAPFIPPPIAAAIPNIDLRPVAENLTAGFLAPFKSQMYYMLGATIFVIFIFSQRFNILTLRKSLMSKLRTSGNEAAPQSRRHK